MKHRIVTLLALLLCTKALLAQGVYNIETSSAPDGEGNVVITISMQIENGWYIYGVNPIKGGPMPTMLDLEENGHYERVGKLTNGEDPLYKIDPGFKVEVEYFEGSAFFRQIIKPNTQGRFTVEGLFTYQTCNGGECILNDSEISVIIDPTAEVSSTPSEPLPKEDKKADSSLWNFLLIAFLAGLGGVITPCVFPMIPMTVGFLLGGGSSRRAGLLKGLIFGLSIIVIYVVLGVIVALFQSTAATDALGTHWIPNLIFAALFIIFAISFLGAFEITLPGSLANKADKEADKGGYLAAFFVALAMVIVSFSCTGPFVGSILAASVMDGVALKPILGMAVFGFAFSLPFVLLSFFPSVMKRLPKSGGWLNVVKVLFAFVMLAFAVKFLYNVDAYFGWGIITRLGVLCLWAALALILGLYFLGIFRTSHDSPAEGIGWGRVLWAIASISFAIYLISGVSGAPLKSISGLIPPQDGSVAFVGSTEENSSSGPAASRYASLESFSTIDEALAESRKSSKPIFLYFKSHTCSVCKVMESTVLNDPQVIAALEDYVIANIYVDDSREDPEFKTLGRRFRDYQTRHFASASQPLYVVIDSDENVLSGPVGSSSVEEFLEFLGR